MVFRCCLSSGIPVYWHNLVWRSLGQVTSQHATPLCIWWELFGLDWFHLTCNASIHKNYNGAHIKGMHRVMLKYSHVLRTELVSIAESSKPQVKAEFTETCPLADWCPAILSFQTGMNATLLNYMCLCVGAVTVPPVVLQCRLQKLDFLQWHPSVGQFQLSFPSGVPV